MRSLISLMMLIVVVAANPARVRREDLIELLELSNASSSIHPDFVKPRPIVKITEAPAEPIKLVETTHAPAAIEEFTAKEATLPTEKVKSEEDESEEVEETEEKETEKKDEAAPSRLNAAPSGDAAGLFEILPEEPTVEVCDETNAPGRSKIYCSGRLLASVNAHHIFPDSKTFVDRPMKVNQTEDEIMAEFDNRFPEDSNDDIDPAQLKAFVEEFFDQEGHELEKCEVADWHPTPASFNGIADDKMKSFALKLHDIWKMLCRKMNPMVSEEPERFSLLSVPNNFIVPGGRFREFYYWDTYWVVKGLLASGMFETTRGMLENFGTIIDRYGFIPNGGRVYYLKRSQPPLLTAMVYEYYEATRNKTFLREMLPLLEKEYDFWQSQRAVDVDVDGVNHTMFQYRTEANVPRPESYREDTLSAAAFPSKGRRQAFLRDIGSAAESGWDFSTRWFADHKSLLSLHTTDIVPVDLNAFICYNLNILSFFHGEVGNSEEQSARQSDYNAFKTAFQNVFYKPEAKGWYDYDLRNKQHNTDFFPSIATPLFTGCYNELSLTQSGDLLDKMTEMGALDKKGGLPTSLATHTQEQWDFPNGWSPLNHMVIEGMRKSDNPRLQQAAFTLAQKWVRSNLQVFEHDNAMWEKYNVETNEARGGGGEYEVQAGFGWTNGVVLDLLLTYGDRLKAEEKETAANQTSPSHDSTTQTLTKESSTSLETNTTTTAPATTTSASAVVKASASPIISDRPTSASYSLSPLNLLFIGVIRYLMY